MQTRIVKLAGFEDLERNLRLLPKATGKNVLRRVAKGALEPMRNIAEAKAPVADEPYYIGTASKGTRRLMEPGRIKMSIVVSEKRTRRAKGAGLNKLVNGQWRAAESTGIDVAMGPGSGTGALFNAARKEFGNSQTAAEPYMRPAWISGSVSALRYVRDNLGKAIDTAVNKMNVKRAKAGL